MKESTKKIFMIMLYLLLFSMLVVSLYFLYVTVSDLKATPVKFTTRIPERNQSSYSSQLQFFPNMRFAKKTISYSIDNSCSDDKKLRVLQAFFFLKNETSLLEFYESENPDIEIKCEDKGIEQIPGFYFIAGEGGPTRIINTSRFYVIEHGKIFLFYNKTDCNNYNIELHELLHVFGFDHSPNPESIMYNISTCNQVVTNDIINELKRLYSITELPDLIFTNISASKKARYLDFTVEFKNIGLKKAENVVLEVYGKDLIESFNISDIGYGEGKFLKVKFLKIPRDLNELTFVLKIENDADKSNNIASLSLPFSA